LIAAPSQPSVDEQLIDEVVDRISTPAAMADDDLESAGLHQDLPPQPANFSEDFAIEMDAVATDSPGDSDLETELDTLFALDDKTAMESADVQYPDEILPPDAIHPVDDELADTLIGAQLSDRRGIQPALADADELAGFNEDAEPLDLPAQSDLVEQLDFLFSDFESDITTEPRSYKPLDADTLDSVGSGNLEPVAALADVAPEDTDIFTDDTLTPENDQIPVALADVQVPEDRPDSDMGQEDLDRSLFDIQDKLDHFLPTLPTNLLNRRQRPPTTVPMKLNRRCSSLKKTGLNLPWQTAKKNEAFPRKRLLPPSVTPLWMKLKKNSISSSARKAMSSRREVKIAAWLWR
jgi:pilus assembly protein FimV